MKIGYVILLTLFTAGSFLTTDAKAQDQNDKEHYETPKLVIGIMVDQMRYDYIYRYWDTFGEDGFKRLVNEGFSFDHARFDYMPTFTGPGHASVYTGTTPAVHGIIGNSWYLRGEDRTTYVTEDPTVSTVGSDSDEGEMSPRWLLSSTITDELIMHNNERSKVVGVSLKDRGSILPAGHIGDAYWFDYGNATMISSTFYMDELPEWAREFNARDLPSKYLSEPWETLLPIEEYTASIEDDNPYEGTFEGQDRPVFPHDLPAYAEISGNGILANTPFGDSYLMEFVYAAIEGEEMGQDEFTDMIALSLSSPDHIGHRYGPPAVEVQDTYLRLDREIARLLDYIDENFGKDEVLIFLTSDHGGAHNPEYLKDLNVPTGGYDRGSAREGLSERLEEIYGFDPVKSFRAIEIYLDREMIREQGVRLADVQQDVVDYLLETEGVAGALSSTAMRTADFTEHVRRNVQRGYNSSRSGDVMYWLDPQWFTGNRTIGTTHGSPYSYDTRAPLIWYGFNVPSGSSAAQVYISDIASTLANFLNIPYTSGNTGNPMNDYIFGK
ncbi:MAG: alkaline phosphatase family protein [Balneolaceae bacterium]|nr:alkaline phosphatase family protein [Balneolaceae bacterium]MCH8550042.1 alkaline phosphatase family protein [Balneolaceae bacterium]